MYARSYGEQAYSNFQRSRYRYLFLLNCLQYTIIATSINSLCPCPANFLVIKAICLSYNWPTEFVLPAMSRAVNSRCIVIVPVSVVALCSYPSKYTECFQGCEQALISWGTRLRLMLDASIFGAELAHRCGYPLLARLPSGASFYVLCLTCWSAPWLGGPAASRALVAQVTSWLRVCLQAKVCIAALVACVAWVVKLVPCTCTVHILQILSCQSAFISGGANSRLGVCAHYLSARFFDWSMALPMSVTMVCQVIVRLLFCPSFRGQPPLCLLESHSPTRGVGGSCTALLCTSEGIGLSPQPQGRALLARRVLAYRRASLL